MVFFDMFKKNETASPASGSSQSQATPNVTSDRSAQDYLAQGHAFRTANQMAQAVECYQAAARTNNAEGLYWLGCCVLTGRGAKQDPYLACQLFALAAKQNHAQATENLFKYLDASIDDAGKNHEFASLAPFLKLGAEAGHLRSVYLYGYFLTVGAGNLPINKEEGYKWIKLAADNGLPVAQRDLRDLF